jgi:hypothetical protein
MRRYYRILEIPYDSSFPIVKQAYRDLVRVWHPDRFCHDERLQKLATEKLMQINEAYRVLRSLSPQEVEQNSAVSQPFSPQAEPIDWSRKATPASPVQDRAPLRKPVGLYRYYGVIAIPIAGILLLLLAEALLEKTYSTDPLPPPRYEAWNNPATGLAPESPDRIPTPDSTESGGLQALSERTISSHSNPFHRFFTLGSTKEGVLAIQGIPTQLNERIWQYGKSLILFENNRVVGWTESPSNPLAVAEGAKQMN